MADERQEGEGFLTRWSRLKREPEPAPLEPPDAMPLPAPAEVADADAIDPELEENRLAAEAVDIDSLGKGDDFSVFLKRGVPELLRKTALRKLWRTDPVFANLDGLNDYDEDFHNPAHKAYKSIWNVAQGFLTEDEQQEQRQTGRLGRPEVSEYADPDETTSSVPPAEIAADDIAGATLPEAGSEVPAPTTDDVQADEVIAAEESAGFHPEADDWPRRRVSIRRRLEG